MPFDVLSPSRPLDATIASLGITPIPAQTLADYKQQQLARHPGSWWYAHKNLGTGLIATSFVLMFAASGACFFGYLATGRMAYAVVSSLCVVATWLLMVSGAVSAKGVLVKGPAYWAEYEIGDPDVYGVPPGTAARAKRIIAELPGARLIIGDLRQETASLDPYLLVRWQRDQVVLGIWDDAGIIMEAGEDGWHVRR